MVYSGCWNGIAIVAIGIFAALALVAAHAGEVHGSPAAVVP
jgi:hypothetical protein